MKDNQANDFYQFVRENEYVKRELAQNLTSYNLFSLDSNKQEDIVLEEMEKLAQKYNFNIDKYDLKKSVNNNGKELDDDQLLAVAGGGVGTAIALLLLTGFSWGSSAFSTFWGRESVDPSTDTTIVQDYEEQEENILLKAKDDGNDSNAYDNEVINDEINEALQARAVLQNAKNKPNDSQSNSDDNNADLHVDHNNADSQLEQDSENKIDGPKSNTNDINLEVQIGDNPEDEADDNEPNVAHNNAASQLEQSAKEEVETKKDTTDAEIKFSLKVLENLPKREDPGFDDFLKLPNEEDLDENREFEIKHSDGSTENITINEKEVYAQIKNTVHEIVQKVEKRTPEENISEEDIAIKINNKEVSKHYKLPKQMRIAKAIYRWVAKNITYDTESLEKDINGEKSFRKPQGALFVFNQKTGVCAGFAALTNVMMRMAGISSGCVSAGTHAYNVIYFENNSANREGWTLIDSTWAAPGSDKDLKTSNLTLEKYSEESLIDSYMNCLAEVFYDDSSNLSYSIFDRLEEVNAVQDSTKMDRVSEYIEFINDAVGNIVKKDLNNMAENVVNVNNEIRDELERINAEYQDIVTFKEFRVFSETDEEIGQTNFYFSAKTSLNYDEAKILAKKSQNDYDEALNNQNNFGALNDMKVFFPGFYNENMDITKANKSILNERSHRIELIGDKSIGESYGTKRYAVEEGGVIYEISGEQGHAHIRMTGDSDKPAENVQIPTDLADFDLPFEVFTGIKSIILNGDETIDTSSYLSLDNINTENSNKYIAEDGILYAKNSDGSKGAAIDIFKTIGGEINGISYYVKKNYSDNKITEIEICNYKGDNFSNVNIPEQLTQFNIPIKIGYGIKSIELKGNQTIDISDLHLEGINTKNSNKYIAEEGILYSKNADGTKGLRLHFC